MNLSLEGVSSYSPPPSVEQPGESERRHNPQRRVHAGAGVLRRTPAVSPGSAEEEDMMPACVPQVRETHLLIAALGDPLDLQNQDQEEPLTSNV